MVGLEIVTLACRVQPIPRIDIAMIKVGKARFIQMTITQGDNGVNKSIAGVSFIYITFDKQ